MKFLVMARGGKEVQRREINKEEFDLILKARAGLLEVLYIEEKFDLLMENYCELEEEILSSSLRYVAFASDIHVMLQQSRLAITRRLVNLLTTCRLYLDQSTHHLRGAFGKSSPYEKHHKAEMSSQYDKHLSYRILEELRNYAQHRGYPFHIITFSSSVIKPEPGADTVTIVMPKLSIAELEEDGGFKSQVLGEIKESYETDFDLRPHVRQYIDCLHSVHSTLRESLQERVAEWKDDIYAARALFRDDSSQDESIWLLEFIVQDDSGEEKERTHFAFHSIDRHEFYAKKNRLRRPLTSMSVSSQIDPPSP